MVYSSDCRVVCLPVGSAGCQSSVSPSALSLETGVFQLNCKQCNCRCGSFGRGLRLGCRCLGCCKLRLGCEIFALVVFASVLVVSGLVVFAMVVAACVFVAIEVVFCSSRSRLCSVRLVVVCALVVGLVWAPLCGSALWVGLLVGLWVAPLLAF